MAKLLIKKETSFNHSKSENDILDYYFNNDLSKKYNGDIKDVFEELSPIRRNVLEWYDIKKDSNALEVGGDFGALTELLCNKCSNVTRLEPDILKAKAIYKRCSSYNNLEIVVNSLGCFDYNEYDYIVFYINEYFDRLFDESVNDLSGALFTLFRHLSTNGRLLILAENKFGARYICGDIPSGGQAPFEHFTSNNKTEFCSLLTKNEIENILNDIGINRFKFYYVLPNSKVASLVYTDQYLPDENICERFVGHYNCKQTMVIDESKLYKDLINNNTFSFFANSYLIECGKNDISEVIFSAISSDRIKSHAFITNIYSDNTVRKSGIYEEIIQTLSIMNEINANLKRSNINTVSYVIEGRSLLMQRIQKMPLTQYMNNIIQKDKSGFIKVFEDVYDIILKSSVYVNIDKCQLINSVNCDMEWGVILKECYIELIHLNCFYDNGNYLFFDQEFVIPNYPAKFVIFRMIYYYYMFNPQAGYYVDISVLKNKFQLSNLWEIFIEAENIFQNELHRWEDNPCFVEYNGADPCVIKRNITALANQSFISDYKINDSMRKIREIELDLLKKFISVCQKYDLSYFAWGGTLLGAVRHHGFIPWDDDIDIAMPRNDFDYLMNIADSVFTQDYHMQRTKENYVCGISRLRHCKTTRVLAPDFGKDICNGIYIDIIPLDNFCTTKKEKDNYISSLQKYDKLLRVHYDYISLKKCCTPDELEHLVQEYSNYELSYLLKEYYESLTAYKNKDVDYYCEMSIGDIRVYEKNLFDQKINLTFEDIQISAPINYNRCLEMYFGSNYMTLPAANERHPHHYSFTDVERPYRFYNNLFCNLFESAQGKKIIVFGAGLWFEDYMNKYENDFPPHLLVDNDAKKWGKTKRGITINKPEAILNTSESDRYVIICSLYFKDIITQLEKMGIETSKVYVSDFEMIIDKYG